MKETRVMMGMPISIEIVDSHAMQSDIDAVFSYFTYVEETFSKFKPTSELSAINAGSLRIQDASKDMQNVLALCEETKNLTQGYFNIYTSTGAIDPSGLVKGWAIRNAAHMLRERTFQNFCVEAGGDMEIVGTNAQGGQWRVGIRDPFATHEDPRIVKVVALSNCGIATSGSYIRGQHIYNPHAPERPIMDVVSITVIGPNVYDADRFATAAFAMGKDGIMFIESLVGYEGYQIDSHGTALMTSGFGDYVV